MSDHRMVMFRARKKASRHPGVGAKIAKLRAEGKPAKQAVAEALNMARSGRLGPKGGYRRVGR